MNALAAADTGKGRNCTEDAQQRDLEQPHLSRPLFSQARPGRAKAKPPTPPSTPPGTEVTWTYLVRRLLEATGKLPQRVGLQQFQGVILCGRGMEYQWPHKDRSKTLCPLRKGSWKLGRERGSEGPAEENTAGHRDGMVFLTHRPQWPGPEGEPIKGEAKRHQGPDTLTPGLEAMHPCVIISTFVQWLCNVLSRL